MKKVYIWRVGNQWSNLVDRGGGCGSSPQAYDAVLPCIRKWQSLTAPLQRESQTPL